jgi:hypothetical protein
MTSPMAWIPTQVILSEATSTPPSDDVPQIRESTISRVGSMRQYEYLDPSSDEALLHSIDPSFVNLRERLIAKTTRYDQDLEDAPARQTFVSTERHSKITSGHIAKRFGIGPERAKATLCATTQRGMRSAILPIGRRYSGNRMSDAKQLQGKFATDTLWATTKSLNSNVATQIYTKKCGFNAAYHLTRAYGKQVGYPFCLSSTNTVRPTTLRSMAQPSTSDPAHNSRRIYDELRSDITFQRHDVETRIPQKVPLAKKEALVSNDAEEERTGKVLGLRHIMDMQNRQRNPQ